ncbi:MAG: hypothetical protein ACRDOL_06275 [Streptosporangiaceae bacterium]
MASAMAARMPCMMSVQAEGVAAQLVWFEGRQACHPPAGWDQWLAMT